MATGGQGPGEPGGPCYTRSTPFAERKEGPVPHKHLQHKFLTGSDASRSIGVATYLGLAAAFVPSIEGLVSSIRDRSYLAATAWALFLVTVAAWALKNLIQHPYQPLPPSDKFQPFAAPSELDAWPREKEVERISAAVERDDVFPVVVGPSGAVLQVTAHFVRY